MTAALEPRGSFRSSQSRPQPNNNGPSSSSASDLPDIDFGFDELQRRMGEFKTRFDDFVDDGRREVLDSRNKHRAHLAELQETTTLKSRNISLLTHSAHTHASTLARETAETAEMHSAISSLSSSRDGHAAHNASLRAAIAQAQTQIGQRLAAQAAYAERIGAQQALNTPELTFYEDYLGLRIESRGDDEIAFVFCCVDERDAERECEVVLDLGRRDYAVKSARPGLRGSEVEGALGRLNEGRELAPFLKEVRGLMKKRYREGA